MKPAEIRGSEVTALFAAACEELNSFSRELISRDVLKNVRSSTYIGVPLSGWKLEKHIEATLPSSDAWDAVWSLELSEDNGKWIVEASASVSHREIYFGLDEVTVRGLEELQMALKEAVVKISLSGMPGGEFYETAIKM